MTGLLEAERLSVAVPGMGWRRAILRKPPPLILESIDLSIAQGKTAAIVGESGAGKSTLARALLGLMPAVAGEVRFKGNNLRAQGVMAELRRGVRFLFQNPKASLNPRMRVGELVAEPIRIHRVKDVDAKAETERALDAVGLAPRFAARYPHELSGGQAGRVCIARALSVRPELIVADEPSAGFDVSVQAEILNLLADLQDRFGLTYLIITHDLGIVRHFCDTVSVLYRGRVIEDGAVASMFAQPRNDYTRTLLEAFRT